MPKIAVNGLSYHYTISKAMAATKQQPPLVLLHGFTGSVANWQTHLVAFSNSYRTIVIDLLGHGQTDAPHVPTRYAMSESARDIVELLATIAPGPFNLLGYSMGGRLALYLAVAYPQLVQRLILESASPGLADPVARKERRERDDALADQIEQEGVVAFVDRWEAIPLFASQHALPSASRERLHQQRLENREDGLANSLRGMGTGMQPVLWNQLPSLLIPTLLLTGALDQKFCSIATEMQKQLPTAIHTTIPHAGHTIHLEQPEAFQQAILAFLSN